MSREDEHAPDHYKRLLSSVRRLCTLLRKPREKRHCISAWLGGGREVIKRLETGVDFDVDM